MSVLIRGMKMPTQGQVMTIYKLKGKFYVSLSGTELCPLIELPDHGDLIDRDALIESAGLCVSDFGTPDERWRPDRDWYIGINEQTAVIPAEMSEE